ncbi:23S rRNA (Guanosine-2'-O-)-methyltransferase rlmB [Elysia marginata]|uniref:23S rRNA (Guanosine-2'-O-)-methyltransferase rlmB n=1 Tax=Elysia marginata TaxID=1093978 RepID=A0AAV4FWM8_9GAST|nr:23S rRNA (Guanosine-2'-O-)-methyltransferase rlmB [Elysia marginata]
MGKDSDVIFGIHSVFEAVKSGKTVEKVFFLKSRILSPSLNSLRENLKDLKIPFSYVPIEKIKRLTKGNHQGVVAKVSPVLFHDFEVLVNQSLDADIPPIFLVLDQLTDVRNFGSLVRTSECAGVTGIIIKSRGSAPITSDTIKTSSGAVFNVPIAKIDNLKDAVFYLQASGIKVVATTEKASQLIYDVNLSIPTAIVVGSEERGISPLILKQADTIAKLPVAGKIESLNVAVAGGIILFEVLRQRL